MKLEKTLDSGRESLAFKRHRLLREYPDYCTASDVARVLDISPSAVRHHEKRLKTIIVEDWLLFDRQSVALYAATFNKSRTGSRFTVKGIDVERLQRICEVYYRTQYDSADKHLLELAKRIAKL